MKILITALLILLETFAVTQAQLVKQWDKRYGGTEPDLVYGIEQFNDGSYIIAGFSFSDSSGDKTQNNWGGTTYGDYWAVRTDVNSQKIWDKHYGGTGTDALNTIYKTSDGNIILVGSSNSGINGDKTQSAWAGSVDYWIVKIDTAGNKLWDKRFGGTGDDYARDIVELPDGGLIIGGVSSSGIGGNRTQASWGQSDYWVVRIDVSGNILWDKRFGGTGYDNFSTLIKATDGTILLGGTSDSGISGDKTQSSRGFDDYWIVNIDTSGNKIWDKRFGGAQSDELKSLLPTADGGFLLGGNSSSPISPDKSQNSFGNYDYWILKTDNSGIKLWDHIYGGTDKEEQEGTLINTFDGNYVISGSSYSPLSGNKTEANLGFEQGWMVKFDSIGTIIYDKTIFTLGHDEICKVIQSNDGCFVLTVQSDAGPGGYKTQPPWGFYFDYWMIKMCDTTAVASPVAAFTYSINSNCNNVCINFSDASQNTPFSWQWLFPGALTTSSSQQNPALICYNANGTYNVTLITCNSGGCDTIQQTLQLTLPAANTVLLVSDSTICNGDSIQITATPGFSSYQWQLNNAALSFTTSSITINQPGNYIVAAIDTNGCTSADSVLIITSTATAQLGNDTAACINNNINLSANTTDDVQWLLNNNAISNTSSITVSQAGTYSIVVTNVNGCTATDSIEVAFYNLPDVNTINDTSLCNAGSVTLITTGAVNYSWSPSVYLDDENSASPISTILSTTTYIVTGTDSNNCSNTDTVTVALFNQPSAAFDLSINLNCNGIEARFINTSSNATGYNWNFGDETNSSEENPVHFYQSLNNTTVSMIAINGSCSDTALSAPISFSIEDSIGKIPNVFTPNNDGQNDCFGVDSLLNFDNCFSLKIFNRWGDTVFSTDNSTDCWNGKKNNTKQEAPEGVYFYLININEISFKGSILLAR